MSSLNGFIRIAVLCATVPAATCIDTPSFAAEDASTCNAQVTTLDLEFEQTEILSPIRYRYEITLDDACQFRPVIIAQMPMICGRPSREIVKTDAAGSQTTRVETVCHFRRPGTFFLPPVQFEIQGAQGQPKGQIEPTLQRVDIAPVYPVSPDPVKSALRIQRWNQRPGSAWMALFGAILVITCVSVAVAVRRARQKKRWIEQKNSVPRPYELFLTRIARLVDVSPSTADEYKQYHDRLSYALRSFLCSKFEFDAMSCTTCTLGRLLEAHGVSGALCDSIRHILSESDRVKFANDIPSHAANLIMLRDTSAAAQKIENDFPERKEDNDIARTASTAALTHEGDARQTSGP